jgi:23S rRNA G2069 N7-methylase RlmK/C1962 C5-methylase RlmI
VTYQITLAAGGTEEVLEERFPDFDSGLDRAVEEAIKMRDNLELQGIDFFVYGMAFPRWIFEENAARLCRALIEKDNAVQFLDPENNRRIIAEVSLGPAEDED